MTGYGALKCGRLRVEHVGKEVELYGWVAARRDHGGVIFIDLRDRWGAVQVVFNPTEHPSASTLAADLRAEYVIHVTGTVRRRLRSEERRVGKEC